MKRSFCFASLCLLATAASATAGIVTSDPYLYGDGRFYRQIGSPTRFQTSGLTIDLWLDLSLSGPPIGPPAVGGTMVSVVPTRALDSVSVLLNGLPPSSPVSELPGSVTIETTRLTETDFTTRILSLDYRLSLPSSTVTVRQSPTTQSSGETKVTPLPDSRYRIDSFFDVWFEISLDDGQSWIPSTTGPSHIELVPAPGVYALAGVCALVALRRRR